MVNNESSDETDWHSCCLYFAHERFSNGMPPIERRRISPCTTVFVSGLRLNHVFHQLSRNSFLEGKVPVKSHCPLEIDYSVVPKEKSLSAFAVEQTVQVFGDKSAYYLAI